MKLCYQVATPDVAIAESVTAYQGSISKTFGDIHKLGYDGVELMTLDPGRLNWNEIKQTAADLDLCIGLICTGELYGQLGMSFADKDPAKRRASIDRVKEIIDFASFLNANVNIGRVRGQFQTDIPHTHRRMGCSGIKRNICTCTTKKCQHRIRNCNYHADQLHQHNG